MVPFSYIQAKTTAMAVGSQAGHLSDKAHMSGADYLAGGTDMIQLMKEHVRSPSHIIDLTGLPEMTDLVAGSDGARLGALVRMSDAAQDAGIREHFPVIAEALQASASPQVRNLATLGGNLLQRTRCGYFRDVVTPLQQA